MSGTGRDVRAVSEVLGTILMFALLVLLLALVQLNMVPAENQQVEFEHNQRVQGDMLSLDRGILAAATENVPGSTQVELAARYPPRFFLLNPGVGAGSIETTLPGTVTLSGVVAPDADHYWNGSDRTFRTRFVRYRPNYHEYRNPPATLYEHDALVNVFGSGAVLPVDSGGFIDGSEINLVTVDGALSLASTSSKAVETTPLSAPAQPIPVTNASGEQIVLRLPTTLSQADWEGLLADELTDSGGSVETVSVTAGDPYNTLAVTLEPGSYDMRLGRVGVGRSVDRSVLGAHYLAAVGDLRGQSIRPGETRALHVQVRDRYNNPIQGNVTFASADGGFVRDDGTTVDAATVVQTADGEARALFEPDADFTGTAVVTATLGDPADALEREEVAFNVTVVDDGTGTNQTSPEAVSSINPWANETVRFEEIRKAPGPNAYELRFYNNGTVDRQVKQVRFLFYLPNNAGMAEWLEINGDQRDRVLRLGTWERIDQTIDIEAGTSEWITLRFDGSAAGGDVFGLSIRYSDTVGNYFVQLPRSNRGGGPGG